VHFTKFCKLGPSSAAHLMTDFILGGHKFVEKNSRTFKHLFQTYSSNVIPHDDRVFNVSGIM